MKRADLNRLIKRMGALSLNTESIHLKGSQRHGITWLRANEAAVNILGRLGVDVSSADMKIITPLIVIHVLDVAKRDYSPALYRYSDANTHTDNLTLTEAEAFQKAQNGGAISLMTDPEPAIFNGRKKNAKR